MNNRQSGRRRGRSNNGSNNSSNNNRPQSGGRGGVDQANRIDSRARGNGAQMIEKYRNLARDAQLAGDRVQTEYYLQFADHYFRVVSDFRARQEESRPQGQGQYQDRQREVRGVEDFDGHDEGDNEMDRDDSGDRVETRSDRSDRDDDDRSDDRGERNERGDRNDRPARPPRDNRENRDNRDNRGDRGARPQARVPNGNVTETSEQNDSDDSDDRAPARISPPPRARRPRPDAQLEAGESTGIDSAVLPPSIGRSAAPAPVDNSDGDDALAPKARRPRRTLASRNEDTAAAE